MIKHINAGVMLDILSKNQHSFIIFYKKNFKGSTRQPPSFSRPRLTQSQQFGTFVHHKNHAFLGNYHLILVGRFACSYDHALSGTLCSWWGLLWQTGLRRGARLRIVAENPMKNRGRNTVTLPGGSPEPLSGSRPRGMARPRVPGGQVYR